MRKTRHRLCQPIKIKKTRILRMFSFCFCPLKLQLSWYFVIGLFFFQNDLKKGIVKKQNQEITILMCRPKYIPLPFKAHCPYGFHPCPFQNSVISSPEIRGVQVPLIDKEASGTTLTNVKRLSSFLCNDTSGFQTPDSNSRQWCPKKGKQQVLSKYSEQ